MEWSGYLAALRQWGSPQTLPASPKATPALVLKHDPDGPLTIDCYKKFKIEGGIMQVRRSASINEEEADQGRNSVFNPGSRRRKKMLSDKDRRTVVNAVMKGLKTIKANIGNGIRMSALLYMVLDELWSFAILEPKQQTEEAVTDTDSDEKISVRPPQAVSLSTLDIAVTILQQMKTLTTLVQKQKRDIDYLKQWKYRSGTTEVISSLRIAVGSTEYDGKECEIDPATMKEKNRKKPKTAISLLPLVRTPTVHATSQASHVYGPEKKICTSQQVPCLYN